MSEIEVGRLRRVHRWLDGDAPPSRGAQIFLFVSALLCGCAVSGLLFVGIWRHTASDAARTRVAQLSDRRQLLASRRALATLRSRLADDEALIARLNSREARTHAALVHADAALARARTALARAQVELAHAGAANSARNRRLTARLGTLIESAGTLAQRTSTLQSELAALEAYALHPGAAGVDTSYVATQARYLVVSGTGAASAAAALSRDVQALRATTG